MPLYEYRDGVLKPVIPIRVIRQEVPAGDCIIIQPIANFTRIRDTTANETHTTTDFIDAPTMSYDIEM